MKHRFAYMCIAVLAMLLGASSSFGQVIQNQVQVSVRGGYERRCSCGTELGLDAIVPISTAGYGVYERTGAAYAYRVGDLSPQRSHDERSYRSSRSSRSGGLYDTFGRFSVGVPPYGYGSYGTASYQPGNRNYGTTRTYRRNGGRRR